MSVAVITLTRNRTPHLVNLMHGLVRGHDHPDELVVAVMGGDDPQELVPRTPFRTEWVHLDVGEDEPLPLAEARNRAVARTDADELVFLDVDCIPGPQLVSGYQEGTRQLDGLIMGGVRYLPPGRPRGTEWDWDQLVAASQQHPSRPEPPDDGLRTGDDHELFWSLTFAVRHRTFDALGGFDDSFRGYGGEDTDLAFTARRHGVPVAWAAGAWCLHQHHATYDPPLDHATEIVVNACRFREKWRTWPMEGWLERFQKLGLVSWDPEGDELRLLREPTEQELDDAHRATAVPSG